MIVDLPDRWLSHLNGRFYEALETTLVNETSFLLPIFAKTFLPDDIPSESINLISPEQSLRSLLKYESSTDSTWHRREDLFADTAKWLCAATPFRLQWLFCEAGYSKIGDQVLAERRHVVCSKRPFLYVQLDKDHITEVTDVLRWARSWRVLGVAPFEGSARWPLVPATQGIFVCDALEGDTLIVTPFLNQNPIEAGRG